MVPREKSRGALTPGVRGGGRNDSFGDDSFRTLGCAKVYYVRLVFIIPHYAHHNTDTAKPKSHTSTFSLTACRTALALLCFLMACSKELLLSASKLARALRVHCEASTSLPNNANICAKAK